MKNTILVVTPRDKINYMKVYPAIIRAIDLVSSDNTQGIQFTIDTFMAGTTSLVVEVINKLEASLRGYGYDVSYKSRKQDIMLHGLKNSQKKWVEKQISDEPDLVLIFSGEGVDVGHAKRVAKEHGVMVVVND